MLRIRRRSALLALGTVAAAWGAGRLGLRRMARPADPDAPLSSEAAALVVAAWKGIDPARTLDAHVHLVGLGAGGTGCWTHPNTEQYLRHPITFTKFYVYRLAAGVDGEVDTDRRYVQRLVSLMEPQQPRGRLLLLPFDQVHDPDGTPRPELSQFFTPNDYALRVAREHPALFVPAASVHPYRRDAVDELNRCLEAGAVAVKWLPNSHRIDPSSPRCDALYRVLADRGVPIITHAGEEQAVEAEEAQRFGNPLHLRRALEAGVKVIVAHCASLGMDPDLDAPGDTKPWVPSFDLFLRMMGEERYRGRLFADLSALCQFNRCERPLREMLTRAELHGRCVHGSDYPLPAVNALVRTGKLESLGYLTADERRALNELDRHNPLLFDFTLKRTLRHREGDREHRFGAESFMVPPGLFPRLG
jgi:uncharacterized protein